MIGRVPESGGEVAQRDNARRRQRIRAAAGIVVSVAAVALIVRWAAHQPSPTFPSSASRIGMLAGALGLYAVATLVRAWRWHEILRLEGIDHRRRDALGLLIVGYMGNTVLPARGGEVLRVLLLGQRTTARKWQIVGSIIAERVLDAAVLVCLFALLTWVGVAGSPTGQLPAFVAAGVVAAGAVALAVYLRARNRGRFHNLAERLRPVAHASRPLIRPVGALLAVATALVWVLEGVIFSLVGHALGLGISLLDGIFLDVLASFFALIPAGPGYVGTFDGAMLFGLRALKMHGGAAVSFVLLVRFILFVPITAVGGILMLTSYGGAAELRRARRAAADRPERAGPTGEPVFAARTGAGR